MMWDDILKYIYIFIIRWYKQSFSCNNKNKLCTLPNSALIKTKYTYIICFSSADRLHVVNRITSEQMPLSWEWVKWFQAGQRYLGNPERTCRPSTFWLTRYLRYPARCSPRRAMWVKLGRASSNVVSKWGDSPFSSNVHTPLGPLEENAWRRH